MMFCFHQLEATLLMSGNKEPDTLMTPLTPFSRGCKPSVYRHYGTLTPLNKKSRAHAREKQNVSNLSCRFFVDLSNRITNSSTYGKRIANLLERSNLLRSTFIFNFITRLFQHFSGDNQCVVKMISADFIPCVISCRL